MQKVQSHGRLWWIAAVVSVPTIVALGLGFEVSKRIFEPLQGEQDGVRLKNISLQAAMLEASLEQELEGLQIRAWALAQGSRDTTAFGPVLHWVEVTSAAGKFQSVKQLARNPKWNMSEALQSSYLKSAFERFQVQDIEKNGNAILRLKKGSQENGEWMSFAFRSPLEHIFYLVLVDPSEAFLSFQKWSKHGAGGKSRSYLLGTDGRVLAHSQKSMVTSDLKNLSFFQQGIQKMLNEGSVVSGSGDFLSVDRLPVGVSYLKVANLPLAVVVEEVNAQQMNGIRWSHAFGFLGLSGIVLFSLILFSAFFLKTFLVKVITFTVRVPSLEKENKTTAHSHLPSESDYFIIDGLRSPE